VIRIDTVWLATTPLDMRAGTDSALARVVGVFGAAHPHTAVSAQRSHLVDGAPALQDCVHVN
jgi:hypothetical protein